MLEAARRLRERVPGLGVAVALAPGLEADRAALETAGVRALSGRTRALEAAADCCVVASGTATLETALFGTPLVVVYRTSALNYAIARRVVTLPHIGLPNIVAGEEVAPELVQQDFSAARLAVLLEGWLRDPQALAARRRVLSRVRERLGAPGAARRTAEWLWAMMP